MTIHESMGLVEARLGNLLRSLARRLAASGHSRPPPLDWQSNLLRHMRRYEPAEGEGPFPTAILLHGCAGDFRHLESWGRYLAGRGLVTYTIDSLTPRGIGTWPARCLVCTGLGLRGDARCRDITTILPVVLADPKVDPERISLIGWSHGAWTVTEWMLDIEAKAVADRAGFSPRSIVLVYPYCGIASNIHEKPWTSRAPVLVVTGSADRIVPNRRTQDFVESLARAGVPVTQKVIEGVGHAFDVEGNVAFDAGKTAELREIVPAFLQRVDGRVPARGSVA